MGIDAPRLLATAQLFVRLAGEDDDAPLHDVCARVVDVLQPPTKAKKARQ